MEQSEAAPVSYSKTTVYIVGDAKTTQNNPITIHYNNRFFITLIIDLETETIVDASASVMLEITIQFIRSIFVGYDMRQGWELLAREIGERYFGGSQNGLLVAWKDAYRKYEQLKKKKS